MEWFSAKMSFEVSEEERRELEYATQFFDFTPDSFVDTVSFTATDILEEELNVSGRNDDTNADTDTDNYYDKYCFVITLPSSS